MVFPIFTNGTLLDDAYCALLDANRHLIPVLSVEGNETETDERRGAGVFASIRSAMSKLTERQILFGVSITVTKENLSTVLDKAFVEDLRAKGCGALFYVEYVPTEKGTEYLSLDGDDLTLLQTRTIALRQQISDMVMLSFPGDEEAMGGCLASGRGFFHINPKGGAEPCPFSPHAKHNLAQSSILQVLSSGYFDALRSLSASAGPHTGGCVLFQKENEVRALLGHPV